MADQGSSQDSIRRFPAPRLSAARAVTRAHEPRSNQSFMPLPAPTGQYPFRLALEEVLPQPAMEAIREAGRIVFHCVGDTGGVKDPAPQMAVADAMERDFGTSSEPSFFYLLGDVVYHYGAEEEYHAQFYEPYRHYPAPVFAFPGNHDGDVDPAKPDVGSLEAFTAHFCAPVPKLTVAAGPVDRAAMTQPNVYFTMNAPFITLIGLYSNVPEGGLIAADQLRWLVDEVRAAPAENALVVGLHHPLYSVDSVHGSNVSLAALVNGAFEEAGRYPDA
ncbi:MAG: acid phosphatase type 7, partial [Thermoleophilaceae bacterium]|nr:acid phosphatase type 7 [Thermoleophilaceae bacterium]